MTCADSIACAVPTRSSSESPRGKGAQHVRLYGMVSPGAFAHPTALGDFYGDYGSALRWRIGRPGVSADAAATMALASMP